MKKTIEGFRGITSCMNRANEYEFITEIISELHIILFERKEIK